MIKCVKREREEEESKEELFPEIESVTRNVKRVKEGESLFMNSVTLLSSRFKHCCDSSIR